MAGWSKLPPKIQGLTCRDFAHPWTDNCFSAAAFTWFDSCIGSTGFFFLLYLCQHLSKVIKKKNKINFKDFLWMQIRSTGFGATVAASTFAIHCLLRKLLGRYHYLTVVFIPAFIGGHAIFLESRKGREFFLNAFANCALELCIRLLENAKVLRWNPNIQTMIFMAVSSFLSSLLGGTNLDLNYFWFFLPPKVNKDKDSRGVCFHKDTCGKHITNLFIMYSITGLLLQYLRLLLSNLKTPKVFLSSLIRPKTFRLAAFLGGYVVLYQTIRCFLYQREKKYSLLHDSLAGFLAGVAFRFQPTIPIFNSAIITAIQILTEMGYRKKFIPNIPYLEIVFAFCCGLLFHSRVFKSEHCPQLMVYIMSGVTHGLSDRISFRFILSSLFSLYCCFDFYLSAVLHSLLRKRVA